MQITLTDTGKRFNREWIFRHISQVFDSGTCYAITGANGSGKSTLLQVIAGSLTYNEGKIQYLIPGIQCPENDHYKYISMAAPYLELIDEMTAHEILSFHRSFKPLSVSNEMALQLVQLSAAADKQVRYYSSGMKQRLRLALAFFSNSPVLLLDEPTTNLDAEGMVLYQQLIIDFTKDKLVIVSSNDTQEYHFCEEIIKMEKYKMNG